MKYIFLLHCICYYLIRLSFSFHFNFNITDYKKYDRRFSKYRYVTADKTSTKVSSTIADENPRTETPSITDICNITAVGNTSSRFKKRSIVYFHSQLTTTETPKTIDVSIFSQRFLNCIHTTVEPECYQILPNRSVYVPLYNMLFNRSNYIIRERLLFVCPDFFDILEEKFSANILIISTVGAAISTVCIILHMIMFLAVEKLRNLPGYCLFSLCISMMITYTISFVQMKIHDHADCKIIGMLMMYSLLSSFFWMNVMSFDVWFAIRMATCKLRLNTNRSMLFRFLKYSFYAWGMPLLITIIAITVDHVSDSTEYQLIFRETTCWFQYRTPLLIYFALPVFVILIANVIFFITSFAMIAKTRSNSGSQDAYDLRSRLFMSLRLGSAMGLMWVFGLIATATQREWIYYLHSLFTALQGVFIFFSFTINKKTQKACRKVMQNKKASSNSILSQEQSVELQ